MGYLHQGHISLVRQARSQNPTVVVSIYVNPSQFGPNEDLYRYPRNLEHDRLLLEEEGVDVLFLPSDAEMYPAGHETWVEVSSLGRKLEGSRRPGHFKGVATVVLKLLNIINPDMLYLGQKDAQQALIVRKMARDLHLKTNICVMPTIRQTDGLALSSRNSYLSADQKRAATVLFKALKQAIDLFRQGQCRAPVVKKAMADLILSEPSASIDYISIACTESLEEMDDIRPPALVSLAVYIGGTRLIDNVVISG
jgi:pantoate--beta-alanine ligase